jgi:hypothetical protein
MFVVWCWEVHDLHIYDVSVAYAQYGLQLVTFLQLMRNVVSICCLCDYLTFRCIHQAVWCVHSFLVIL